MSPRRSPRTVRMRGGSGAGATERGWGRERTQTQDPSWEDDWHQAGDEDFDPGFGHGAGAASGPDAGYGAGDEPGTGYGSGYPAGYGTGATSGGYADPYDSDGYAGYDDRAAGWSPDAAYDPRQRTELIDSAEYGDGFRGGDTDPYAQPVAPAYQADRSQEWDAAQRQGRARNPGRSPSATARRRGRHRHNARSYQEDGDLDGGYRYGPGASDTYAPGPCAPARGSRAARPARRTPFFSAWRTITLLVVLALALSTALYLHGPAQIRQLFYPLSYQAQIAQASSDHQVSPYLIAAVIQCESGWDPDARSDAGAVGLMQMLPATAQQVAQMGLVDASRYPVAKLADPEVNIQYGSAYLRYLVEHYGELEHAIAAYNAGIGTVDAWASEGANIRDEVEYPETSHYLLRVVRSKEAYEQIYPDAFPGWVS